MEVKKQKKAVPSIKTYAGIVWQYTALIAIASGVLVTILSIVIPSFFTSNPNDTVALWLVALSAGALTSICVAIAAFFAIQPLQTLLRAITHVTEEPLTTNIPNPHMIRSRLGAAVEAVYSLAKAPDISNRPAKQTTASTSANRMHGALIALDASRNVVYASRSAPTHTIEGMLRPQLLFNGSDSLDAWLDECAETTVKAERFWERIPDRPADVKGQRVFDIYASYEKGSACETVLTAIDMTDRYQEDEDDLNFIAFAAHELRGPITVIRGYIDVLQDELDDTLAPDQRELFRRLSVSASRLSGYVNNILNTSKYDRRHLSLTLTPTNIADVYTAIHDDMELRASSQNRLLSVTFPDNLPKVAADRASLSEVISNLIDNAIKYSYEGGMVTVTAEQHGDFVDISIVDHGIGMASDVVKNLFQKFYRSHRSRETVAGSGIGLYISKAIVESHGGTISVRSTEGKGSTFTVSIPTYASVADKITADGSNQNLISHGSGWIKNHAMYRG